MSKRNTQQRRHQILSQINEAGEATVEELARQFETSEVTIRKDLAAMEVSGLLLRRHGGAIPLPRELVAEDPLSQTKRAIGRAAAELIRDHNRIVIDYGRTTTGLIPELNHKRGLVVMTNSLHVANQLRELENEPTLLMTGGTWDPHFEAFQGQVAEQVLRGYDFDQAFIGADGIDLERGTCTFNEQIGLSRVMADVAREVVVMAESSKVGRRIPNLELSWDMFGTLVTDSGIEDSVCAQLESRGLRVICADVN
ncbi:DeoR/GlpR family DNA-binding transcription regulator [Microbulbifer hydrolyticus]|uniref:DeoR family transcriptional regulator n=1 Tax=Microbulbifer hydrolyticus TaxID=48074 RepID=A0A6P1T8C5_9GAMM|nr:DeoR family transcriptional regulator [Microbulbifer hydrolyticus]MBB5211734.1 DeoR/GlpR family transcriptional regulator of sugar metabolism [Microbulbifer hydrolyticus]QHQ37539.1 DeoR family transcriptional regulator [Microbulbifer hydrolyticus]